MRPEFWLYLLLLSSLGTEKVSADGSARAASHPVASARGHPGASAPAPTYLRNILPLFMGKCARCHNDQSVVPFNWLDYPIAYRDRTEIKRRVWQSWSGTYYKQAMPAGTGPEAQTMTEAERVLVRTWVEAGAPYGSPVNQGMAQTKGQRIELGQRLFLSICAACHQSTGRGIPKRFPPLAGSDFLNADKQRAIRVLLHGLQGEVTVNGQKFNNTMPRFPLSDEDIANALTYVYNALGNSGQEVTPLEVKAARTEKDEGQASLPTQSARIPEEKSPFE